MLWYVPVAYATQGIGGSRKDKHIFNLYFSESIIKLISIYFIERLISDYIMMINNVLSIGDKSHYSTCVYSEKQFSYIGHETMVSGFLIAPNNYRLFAVYSL